MWSAFSRTLPQFAPARRPHARRQLTLERLEDRTMLSTISLAVTTLADSGVATLRSAITTADQGAASNSYVIKFAVKGTIDLTSALPDLSNNIVIEGPGALNLTVQRDSNAAKFSVFVVDNGMTVSVSGLTIAGGVSGGSGSTNSGGGIDNNGTLTVIDSIFTHNYAIYGGGIANGSLDVGSLTVANSAFVDNSAIIGGGIYNGVGVTARVVNSAFVDNSAGDGGGIDNESYGTLTVANSIFADNSAGGGGGICNDVGTLTVANSIFVHNSATEGGGIFNNHGTLINTENFFFDNTGGDIYP